MSEAFLSPKPMTTNLANYLFNKETLYRTDSVQQTVIEATPIAEKPVVAETKAVVPVVISPPIPTQSTPPAFIFKHKVLILTDSISESEKALLSKILGAIGATIEQVDLVELSKTQTLDYQSFITQNITQKVISFGVGLGKINWSILLNIYQPKNVSGVDFLLSDELRILETNRDLKQTLWGALKAMFSN